jgi:hypothetical protein
MSTTLQMFVTLQRPAANISIVKHTDKSRGTAGKSVSIWPASKLLCMCVCVCVCLRACAETSPIQ